MATYFDPKAYKIILVDQRGCGKSKPFAELRENTTPEIINDFEKLRKHLKIEKWQLFGGSWGSTLALSYAVSSTARNSFFFILETDQISGEGL
jgi:proline iminopeptidase